MSMLELRHLRLVQAIAEEGGPTRAAARLHLTQSAVSHQLAELEGRLGLTLFTRVRRHLKLTPPGARLVEAAQSMLREISQIEADLHRVGTRKREVLRICVETFTAYYWLPSIVAKLAEESPHVDVRIALGATSAPVAALLRGEIELALVASPVRDTALVIRPLFDDEWTVIIAPKHRLAARSFVDAVHLGQQTLFVHEAPRSDVERLRGLLSNERAPMPKTVRVPLTDSLVDFVSAGLGVGLVSRWAVAPQVARGDVVMRRLTRGGLPESWAAVYRRDAAVRLPLERFATLLRETSGNLTSRKPSALPRSSRKNR